MRAYHFELESVETTPEKIATYDMLLLATAHKVFDYDMFNKNAQLIVDTRGVYLEPADNIVKA